MSHIERDVRGEYLAPDVTPPDPIQQGVCSECNEPIYDNDMAYYAEEGLFCDSCYDNFTVTRKGKEEHAAARELGRNN